MWYWFDKTIWRSLFIRSLDICLNTGKNNKKSCLKYFRYTLGMFKTGYRKTLEVDDLYNPIKADRSQTLGDRLER